MHEQALGSAKSYYALMGHSKIPEVLDRGYAVGGYPAAMRRAAEALAARSKQTYVAPMEIAGLYAHAGEEDRSLEWLEKAYEQHDTQLCYARGDPVFESLRGHPRSQALMRRMKFPVN